MKTSIIAVMTLLLSGWSSAYGQVTNFSVFKVTVYHQSSATAPSVPDSPNAYYFAAQLNTLDSSNYTDVNFSGPGVPTTFLDQLTPYNFDFGSPYYSDKDDFDADYPSGEYDFVVDYTNSSSDFGSVTIPDEELYATNIAAFTTNCWTAMQQVDPAKDFTLVWNSFAPSPDTTSAYSFVDIFNEDTGEAPFSADFLTPDTITTNIPANTLNYGETYRVNTFFSSRQDTVNAGFGGAFGTVAFDNLTYTTLVTIPPWLHITAVDTNIVLTWPSLVATNFVLESATQLSPTNLWTVVTNMPTTIGTTNSLSLPVTAASQFFRLASH